MSEFFERETILEDFVSSGVHCFLNLFSKKIFDSNVLLKFLDCADNIRRSFH